MGGLMIFIKGWKRKVTPLGRQYCQLAVSARHTVVTDYSLWPTPNARDYFPPHKPEYIAAKKAQGHGMSMLNDAVSLFPTPTARDYRGGFSTNSDAFKNRLNHSRGVNLVEFIQRQNQGIGGSLNPAWVAWLMGYPTAWESCADMVTPSFRKSRQNLSKQRT
jgi:hypothetical protein